MFGEPTRKRYQFRTRRQAENAARYVNDWGIQASRYCWHVEPHPDGGYELRRTPRLVDDPDSVFNEVVARTYRTYPRIGQG